MTRFSIFVSALIALTLAPAAYAQQTPAPAQGPLTIERIHNGIVVAPDYKVTEIDGDIGQLAGAYVGRVLDDRLLIGGAGYWLANGTRGTDLRYGGVVVGWSTAPGRIRFGARGLVGGGTGTLTTSFDNLAGGRIQDPRMMGAGLQNARDIAVRFGVRMPTPTAIRPLSPVRLRVREDFFVFEPQVNAVTKVTDHIAVDLAAGYRLIGAADLLGDRLDGATGSLGLQFGW